MKHIRFLLFCAVAISTALIGCSDGNLVPVRDPDPEQVVHPLQERARPLLIEMDALDEVAGEPDGGVGHWTEGTPVELPAGSEDALADAIAAAGEGGIVLVKAGLHTESDGVTITHAIRIVGEPGAVMQFSTEPFTAFPGTIDPALHVMDVAGRVVIWGLEIIPEGPIGGTAILLEDSPITVVGNNTIRAFQLGVYGHYSADARIYGNTIETSPAWQTGELPTALGITIANGDNVGLKSNDVSLGLFGVWLCDGGAVYKQNNTHDNLIGFILCKVPEGSILLPNGESAGSANSGHETLVFGNTSTDNLANGYLVIDGAYDNLLLENRASNNGTYDIELAGDSYRFGFLTPACFDNVAIVEDAQVVKDCGNENTVVGGTLVDNELDPCY